MESGEKAMKTSAQRTSASLHAMGRAAKIGAGAGVLALGAVLVGSVKKAADFEAQISSLGSVSGATGKQMQALRKAAMDAGAATKYSALEAAQAQTELAKGGLSVTKILGGGLSGALALAAAGEMELAAAAETTANALNLFKLNGNQATRVADMMATAANATTADVADFAMALVQGGAAAKAAGLSFDQTIVALEALASSGVKGSDAGTSMKAAFTQLASPTARSAELMDKLGLQFFRANGTMKEMPQLAAMLGDKLGGLTKQQRLQAATTLVGTDGMRALLALYDTGAPKLEKFGRGLKEQGTAAQVAAEKQDNLKGRLENLQGSIETAGIKLGTRFLPMLEKGAIKATEFVNGLVASGGLDKFADGLEDAFRVVGEVLGDIVGFARPIASIFLDIGQALGGLDATNIEAILAAIVGFKVARTVVPMVATLASAVSDLMLNARTAPSLGAFFKSIPVSPLTAAAVAAGGLAAALVLLGDRESAEARLARENAEAHDAQAKAIRSVMEAERVAAGDALGAQQADLNLAAAKRALAEAAAEYGKKSPEYKQALLDQRQAALDATYATIQAADSIEKQDAAAKEATKGARERLKVAQREVEARSRPAVVPGGKGFGGITPAQLEANARAQAQAIQNVTARTREYVQALARAAVTDLSRQRLMNASTQITEKSALGVSKLITAMKNVPARVQSKILLDNQQALARAGSYAARVKEIAGQRVVTRIITNAESAQGAMLAFRAIVKGVPASKIVNIVANATSKKDEVDKLQGAIKNVKPGPTVNIQTTARERAKEISALQSQVDNLRGKTITITTIMKTVKVGRNAAGRRSGRGETSLVGEGGGPEWVIDGRTGLGGLVAGPTVMALEPQDYVIPTESRYRGRAVGLLADVASSLGVAYAKGKKGHKHPAKPRRYVPGRIDPLSLPVDDFEDRVRKAQDALGKVKTIERNVPGEIGSVNASIRDIERRKATTAAQKANKADDLKRAKGKLARLQRELGNARAAEPKRKADLEARQKELRAAKAYAAKLAKQTDLADIAADAMALADKQNDQEGYDKALKKRTTALGEWKRLLVEAQGHVPANSPYGRALAKALGQVKLDLQDAGVAQSQAQQDAAQAASDASGAAAGEAPGTFTKAEQDRLDDLDAKAALAALTDDANVDDIAVATELERFLTGVLASAQADPAKRGGSRSIAEAARALGSARATLAELTRPPDKTADQQAELEQLRTNLATARQEAAISAAWAQTAGGPGDIGAGGGSARGTVININQNNLHPGDPKTLRAIGDAASAGIGYQGFRDTPRAALGY